MRRPSFALNAPLNFSLSLVLGAGLVVGACAKSNAPTYGFSSDAVAQAAAESMGPDEAWARTAIEEMTAILVDNKDDSARLEDRMRAYLVQHQDEFPVNARRLEIRLASLEGDDRIRYEENYSNYLGPATKRWRDAMRAYETRDSSSARRVQRLLRSAMSSTSVRAAVVD